MRLSRGFKTPAPAIVQAGHSPDHLPIEIEQCKDACLVFGNLSVIDPICPELARWLADDPSKPAVQMAVERVGVIGVIRAIPAIVDECCSASARCHEHVSGRWVGQR